MRRISELGLRDEIISAHQVHAGADLGWRCVLSTQKQLACDDHQMNLDLHAREDLADTVAWTCSEGTHLQAPRIVLEAVRALGIEAIRVPP